MTAMKVLRHVPGMGPGADGKVYDFRGTGLCPPNGGIIPVQAFIHHIPVVHNQPGISDLEQLGRILRGQGLAIQCATDAAGNVALYTDINRLCYGHRGLNDRAAGCEHMHYTTGEKWSKWQMRAAAWVAAWAHRREDVPLQTARLTSGGYGRALVERRGHTSHRQVSIAARYFDRSDPGGGFDYGELYDLTRFYLRKGRF